eukprot:3743224-Prymnesium_polylepis.2
MSHKMLKERSAMPTMEADCAKTMANLRAVDTHMTKRRHVCVCACMYALLHIRPRSPAQRKQAARKYDNEQLSGEKPHVVNHQDGSELVGAPAEKLLRRSNIHNNTNAMPHAVRKRVAHLQEEGLDCPCAVREVCQHDGQQRRHYRNFLC